MITSNFKNKTIGTANISLCLIPHMTIFPVAIQKQLKKGIKKTTIQLKIQLKKYYSVKNLLFNLFSVLKITLHKIC